MKRKIEVFFDMAFERGHDTLVLGALGCGAFGHDNRVIADIYDEILTERAGMFRKVVFAVLDANPQNPNGNFAVFNNQLNGKTYRLNNDDADPDEDVVADDQYGGAGAAAANDLPTAQRHKKALDFGFTKPGAGGGAAGAGGGADGPGNTQRYKGGDGEYYYDPQDTKHNWDWDSFWDD